MAAKKQKRNGAEPTTPARPVIARIEHWAVSRLNPLDRNPREHSDEQIDEIARSIERFGFLAPLVVNEKRGIVLAGNGRLAAAIQLGLEQIPVIPVGHLSEAEQKAYVIADNQIALHASWDHEILAEYFAEIERLGLDPTATSFSQEEIDAILAEFDEEHGSIQEDEAPAPPEDPVSRPGDLWRLGDHLVLCGDATNPEDVKRITTSPAAMSFTDVPYDIAYKGCARDAIEGTERRPIANDDLRADYEAFLGPIVENILRSTAGVSYVCIGQQRAHTLREAWLRAGGHLSSFIVWAKSHFVLGGGDYNPRFELLLYGWREGAEHPWYGPENESNVWEIDKPAANPFHPTQKPVELVARAIQNSSRPGDVVLDLCAGSGTTLIAAQHLGRKARVIEIDPAYVDVIIERWQNLTNSVAILESTGQSFDNIAAERKGAACR